MMRTLRPALLCAALALAAPASFAQTAMPGSAPSPADQAFMDGMARMNQAMKVPMSGNPDRDFATMMIPHHQGAIDMAKVELQYGKDPAMRRLATSVIAAQQREIALMKRFLAKP